jgi:hypothetical protein
MKGYSSARPLTAIARGRTRENGMDAGAINSTALFSRPIFGGLLTSKLLVLAAALAVASLGNPIAGKAQEPIKIDLPVTSIGGFPDATVGFLVTVIDSKSIDAPGQFIVLETDKNSEAIGSVLILPTPTPTIKL